MRTVILASAIIFGMASGASSIPVAPQATVQTPLCSDGNRAYGEHSVNGQWRGRPLASRGSSGAVTDCYCCVIKVVSDTGHLCACVIGRLPIQIVALPGRFAHGSKPQSARARRTFV
jgi:hypothetical protein